ncbi:MAG: hypothetical protein IPL36_02805 [Nigerium sp.]|nr:hypothetical protein [Nigerium sp.]
MSRATVPGRRQAAGGGVDTGRDERGSALLLSALVVVVIVALTGVLVVAGLVRAAGERTRGAADLAALAGARVLDERAGRTPGGPGAERSGDAACAAVSAVSRLNGAETTECALAGDEVEYVVTVAVRSEFRVFGLTFPLRAHANAGMVTGALE